VIVQAAAGASNGAHAVRAAPARSCANCRFFRADPHELERAIPGLLSFGSGHAAVRAHDGLCERHDRYLSAASSCGQHEPA